MRQHLSLRTLLPLLILGGIIAGLIAAPAYATPEARQEPECTFTPASDTAIYAAPLTHATQQQGTVPAGYAFTVLMEAGEHYYIALEDGYGGWVDRRSGTLAGTCDRVPLDDTPLWRFPSVCALTSDAALPLYGDATLTDARDTLPAGRYYAVQQAPGSFYVMIDHAYGGWVANAGLITTPACARLPYENVQQARALPDARVWTAPDVTGGEVLYTLPEAAQVQIVGGPVEGTIRADTGDQGTWYQVTWGPYAPGWVWSERLSFDTTPAPAPPTSALTSKHARAWSVPNVLTGSIIAELPEGLPITVLSGPVQGPITLQGAVGDWVQVQWGLDQTGWMWVGRIIPR